MLKLLLFLLLLSLSDLHAEGQTISLSVSNAPLKEVMASIEKQSKFTFIYSSNALQHSNPVTLQVSKEPLEKVLQLCFANQPLSYETEDHFIILKVKKAITTPNPSPKEIKGKVVDENGEGLIGATVHIVGTTIATATDQYGFFSLVTSLEKFTLEVSSIGYETILVSSVSYGSIVLKASVNSLNETIVIAYGQTTRRFNVGTISRINSTEISKQSNSNPLMLLQGRVPGLIAEQNNGIPGSHINLLVRGQGSLKQGTQPMIIIDGVPLTMNSSSMAQLGYSANQNVLNLINAADLESIEVLKDADATAIYGSQGANGVILLTTKKGSSGKTKVDVSLSNGFGKIARPASLLSTPEYLAMRKEAFQNDGVSPDASNAPDLLQWSSTAYTDWQKMLIGGTARTGNYQASISGGNAQTNFLLSGNYYTESTVFPGDQPFRRGTARLAINHKSSNEKFRATISSYYSTDEKRFPITDLSSRIYLPPNAPAIYNPDGNLNWNDWPNDMDNPMAYALQQYRSNYDQWISNASVQYEPVKGLVAKVTGGYSFTTLKESTIIPIQAQRPTAGITGTLAFADNMLKSWIIEPQLTYTRQINHHHIEMLAGASTQQRNQQNQSVQGTGYTNDDLLENIAAAPILAATNGAVLFRYQAAYGRVQYRFRDRYLFNFNFRRDASSRFGPANRFANFGAVGAAWIFSDEPFFQKIRDVLSFGKLRSSYGITGNDQIGDYRFIDSWSTNTNFQYQGNAGLLPTRFFNPYLEWERNSKFEVGLDLGFFQDRLSINSNYYLSRSDNQLVNYKLPALTGFTSITQNLNAIIQNDGLEFQVSYTNSEQRKFRSTTSFTLSLPRTKLVAYPNLSTSSDNNNYIVGKPLSLVRLYQFTGISSNGVYQFTDANSDGLITTAADQIYSDFIVRNYYGGLQQNFKWNNWELDILLFFPKQNGLGYPYYLVNAPGTMTNQPSVVLERWDNNHQLRSVQRFTTTVGSPAYTAYTNYRNSDANIVDASFIRLRNVNLSYQFPTAWMKRWHIERAKVFAQGQNLLTLTNYEVADPETRSALSLPPLKLFSFGFQLTL